MKISQVLLTIVLTVLWMDPISVRDATPALTQTGRSALAFDYGNYRPHFQGFGTATTGGSGRHLDTPSTTIYHVTSLSNRGPGSLRECVEASGPRVCVFDTSGTIALTTSLQIVEPYITIACQTAPSPGIAVRVYETFFIRAHDVVIQHCWHGNAGVGDVPGHQNFYVEGPITNVVLDHVTATGATQNNVIFWRLRASDPGYGSMALLDSINAESVDCSFGGRGNLHLSCVSSGINIGPSQNGQVTLARNLFTTNTYRNPVVQAGVVAQIINNLSYNIGHDFYPFGGCMSYWASFTQAEMRCGSGDMIGDTSSGWELQVVRIGNRLEAGPLTDANSYGVIFSGHLDTPSGSTSMYQSGNIGIRGTDWADVLYDSGATEANTRIDVPPAWHSNMNFAVLSPSEMRAHVLSNAGARPTDRHPSVQAYITQVFNNAGVSVISDTYTMPTLAVNSRPVITPVNPNGPGNCGNAAGVRTTRTRLECFLEHNQFFGARRLEPRWSTFVGTSSGEQ